MITVHFLQRGIEAGLVSRENEGTAVFSVNTTVPAGKEVRTEFMLLPSRFSSN